MTNKMPMKGLDQGQIGVVVLNYNSGGELSRCVRNVLATNFDEAQIIVVDNASSDDSFTAVRHAHTRIHFHETGQNGGYCKGNNAGIAIAKNLGFSHVLILNPDCQLQGKSFQKVLSLYQPGKAIPLLLPTLITANANARTSFKGTIDVGRPGIRSWYCKRFLFWGDPILQNRDARTTGTGLREIHFFIGCAILVDLGLVPWADLFDPEIFINGAEAELMLRCVRSGIGVFHGPAFIVRHEGGITHGPTDINYLNHARAVIYASRKHHSGLVRLLFPLYYIFRSFLGGMRDFVRYRRITLAPRFRGMIQGWQKTIMPGL